MAESPIGTTAGSPCRHTMSSNTVLVIDDDPDTRSLFKHYLEAAGHAVLLASDGTSGLQIARSRQPDLILLDLALPSGNGLEVLQQLKQPGNLAGVPVMVVTSLRSSACRAAAIAAQASAFLPKPIERGALLAAVRDCLSATNPPLPSTPSSGH